MKYIFFLCVSFNMCASEHKVAYVRRFEIPQEMRHHFNQEGDAFYSDTLSVHVSKKDDVGATLSSLERQHDVCKSYDSSKIRLGFNPRYWNVTDQDCAKHKQVKPGEFPIGTKIQTIYDSVSLQSFVGLIAQLNAKREDKKREGKLNFLGTDFLVTTQTTKKGIKLDKVSGGKSKQDNKDIFDLLYRYLCITKSEKDSKILFFAFSNKGTPLNYVEGNIMFGLPTDSRPGITVVE